MILVDRELMDFEIVTALVAGQIAGGHCAKVTGDVVAYSEIVDAAEAIVLEVVRRNDERTA